MEVELANGGELFDVIEKISPIEWRKYQSRIVNIDFKCGSGVREDRVAYPPYTSFRFVVEDQFLMLGLRSAIENYKGGVEWVMEHHDRVALPGRNWIVQPRFVKEVREEVGDIGRVNLDLYIAKKYPDFGAKAYADLLLLSKYIENIFFGKGRVDLGSGKR
ncbi:hypothetical protein [Burkholderia stagnalis]|uniref:hypothetical protein n=1 Tax=Burkholderia stagnalis TaxID=1503054 RepID=UPI0012D94D2F|nr:hypothetical protein [Burkholderia stagnalis]